jgi:hypothetical protein
MTCASAFLNCPEGATSFGRTPGRGIDSYILKSENLSLTFSFGSSWIPAEFIPMKIRAGMTRQATRCHSRENRNPEQKNFKYVLARSLKETFIYYLVLDTERLFPAILDLYDAMYFDEIEAFRNSSNGRSL